RHFLERRRPERRRSCAGIALRLARYIDQKRNAVDPLAPRQPSVERELLLYKQTDQDSGGKAHGQAGDIDKAEELVTNDAAKCGDQIVVKHSASSDNTSE